ncbi:MAG: AraC family transcriptional regulator [Caulobacteraceae bacterium]|jgi:AraC family transcriptional regulator|nr:AraC family transcriptional regulator [Caulobacteraceae bacterium]
MSSGLIDGFSVQETHGILWRPENQVRVASDGLGWSSLYASTQREAPYEAEFAAVDDHLIILHLDGPVGVARALGKSQSRRVIAPGGLFMLPGGVDFGVRLEGYLDSLHLYLRQQVIDEVADDCGMRAHGDVELLPRLGVQDPLIEQLALSVRDVLMHHDPSSQMYVDYLARLLAAHLLRKHSSLADTVIAPLGGLSRAQVERAIDYMESNLCEPLTLADVANASGLSPSHFARRFKSATGAPPHQYLISMRVERAKRLLLQREPIAEIALECGFSHQEHLTRVFRRLTGVTPASFRRAAQS